jgi:hypothetical protein
MMQVIQTCRRRRRNSEKMTAECQGRALPSSATVLATLQRENWPIVQLFHFPAFNLNVFSRFFLPLKYFFFFNFKRKEKMKNENIFVWRHFIEGPAGLRERPAGTYTTHGVKDVVVLYSSRRRRPLTIIIIIIILLHYYIAAVVVVEDERGQREKKSEGSPAGLILRTSSNAKKKQIEIKYEQPNKNDDLE